MSAKITGMVFERYPEGGGEMLCALALADHAHDDGTHIYPKLATLAAKTRQSARTVQYQLRRMEARGWLQVVGAGDGGRGRAREYRINPAWIEGDELRALVDEKGAKVAPFDGQNGAAVAAPFEIDSPGKGAATVAAFEPEKGCNPRQERVQSSVLKGAAAIAPAIEPQEPSRNHSPLTPQGDTGLRQGKVAERGASGRFDAGPARDREEKPSGLSMARYLARCAASGVKPVPADDAVWRYASKVDLPDDLVALAWFAFKRRHLARPRKLQRDWRQAFRNYVEGNYYRLWLLRPDGAYALSTQGQQEQRLMEAELAEQEAAVACA